MTGLANDEALSSDAIWRAHDALGEIGTREACCAVVELMDLLEQQSQVTDAWQARVAALSKMYQHLDDSQYEKYGSKIVLSRFCRMNAWYIGLRRVPQVTGMDKFLDSNEEWVRRPGAIYLGIMGGSAGAAKLKQYLRHAPSDMDSVFILGGLLRSGALEYYPKYYEMLGKAITYQTISTLDYLWKCELTALLTIDPNVGKKTSDAWADLFSIDVDECMEEIAQIMPPRAPQPGSTVKAIIIAGNDVPIRP